MPWRFVIKKTSKVKLAHHIHHRANLFIDARNRLVERQRQHNFKIGTRKILTKKISWKRKEKKQATKLNWNAEEIKKEMATISIENKSKVPGFEVLSNILKN
jgi:hypothetical protein